MKTIARLNGNQSLLAILALGVMIASLTACQAMAKGEEEEAGSKPEKVDLTTIDDDTLAKDSDLGPGDYRRKMSFGGLDRYYDLHVPASYKKGKALPLVVCMHGGGGNPVGIRDATGMDAVADKNGFIVAYPAGTGGGLFGKMLAWNVILSENYATTHDVDDVGFLGKVIDEAGKLFGIDDKRVYATGYSQGGMMSYRLACELNNRIAAIAPVGGVMTVAPDSCKAGRAVPIIHFHGEKDEFCLYKGGTPTRVANDKVERPSVMAGIEFWAKVNKVSENKAEAKRIGNAVRAVWGNDDEAQIVLWSLEDGGHTWPGGFSSMKMLGGVNRDVIASQLIWNFFEKHPLK